MHIVMLIALITILDILLYKHIHRKDEKNE